MLKKIIIFFFIACSYSSLSNNLSNNFPDEYLTSVPISGPLEYIRQAFDVTLYDAEIDLTEAPDPEIQGVCRIHFNWVLEPDTNKFYFHLRSLSVDSVFYNDKRTTAVEVGTPDMADYHYEIEPPAGTPLNDNVITIFYSGIMTAEPGNYSWGGVFSDDDFLYSIGVGFTNNYVSTTQHWLPCYDLPSDKAKYKAKFKVDEDFTVASNGILTDVTEEDGYKIYSWQHDYNCATYMLTFAVSDFDIIEIPSLGTPVVVFAPPELDDASRYVFRKVPDMISAYEDRFGAYPFDKAGYVCLPMSGAMEHQTMISIDKNAVRNAYLANDSTNSVVAHELAHQWFGGKVTCRDFRDTWLNEGFATFCEAIWYESFQGKAGYLREIKNAVKSYLNYYSKYEGIFPLFNYPHAKPSSNYPGTIYQKGSAVLAMLRYHLGDSLFFGSLNDYLNTYANFTATSQLLQGAFEEYSGEDLDWFFDQWVFQAGWPKLTSSLKYDYDTGGRANKLHIKLNQAQNPDYYVFTNVPVEISFKDKSGRWHYRIAMLQEDGNASITIDSAYNYELQPGQIEYNQGLEVVSLVEVVKERLSDIREDQPATDFKMKIIPQPAGDGFKLKFYSLGKRINIKIYNIAGEEVYDLYQLAAPGFQYITIDTTNFLSGNYLIRVVQGRKSDSIKLIVTH